MKMSGVSRTCRSNLTKTKSYKKRNWNGYDEKGIKVITTAPLKKLTKLQKTQKRIEEKMLATQKADELQFQKLRELETLHEAQALEFQQKMARERLKIEEIKNSLERTPKQDILDISGEEQGFFKLNGKIISTIFPR